MVLKEKVLENIYGFKRLNSNIKNYMFMHWMSGICLSYTIILPSFMKKLNIEVLEAGVVFSIVGLIDVIFTYLLRKSFDKISPNRGMALDFFTESWPVFILTFASTYTHIFIALVAQKCTNILNPCYRVYENEIFPEEKRTLIYRYHLYTPEIIMIVVLPIIGFLLTYKFDTIEGYHIMFFVFGVGFMLISLIPRKILKPIKEFKIASEKIKFKISKELYLVATIEILLSIATTLTSTFKIYLGSKKENRYSLPNTKYIIH